MAVEVAPKLDVRREFRHAVTVDGRKVLIHASGDVSPLHKAVAAYNMARWQKGKRTWLL